MATIVDLTMPIENHFRWAVERRLAGDFAEGDQFQITWAGWAVHGFTHVDAPRHMLPDGPTTSETPLETLIGECAILDVSHVADRTPIDAVALRQSGPTIDAGDLVLVKAEWDKRYSYLTAEFWTESPYLTRDAAEWLLACDVRAVAFDFPQDYPIRQLLDGETAPIADFVTHDVLLRNNVILIEYLCNTAALRGENTTLYVLPLKLMEADGAPTRVIALEDG